MGSLRRKMRVGWSNQEPVELQVTARDLLNATNYVPSDNVTGVGLAQIYAALVRHGHEVPPFETWLDEVDDAEPIGLVVDVEGPTQPAAPDGVLQH